MYVSELQRMVLVETEKMGFHLQFDSDSLTVCQKDKECCSVSGL